MNIKYVAVVNSTTGEIKQLFTARGQNLAEGYHEELGGTVVHIFDELLSTTQFVNTTYYDMETSTWLSREAKPNGVATWDGSAWTWNNDDLLNLIRLERNSRIQKTDWAVLPDSPLTEAQKTEAQTYRQGLRDISSTVDMSSIRRMRDVVWPTKPDFL